MREEMKKTNEKQDEEFKKIFSGNRFKAYLEWEKKMEEQRRARMQERR